MIIHNIDSNSTWVEPIEYNRGINYSWTHTETQMYETVWNSPKNQVLYNEAYKAYKDAIRESVMTYQLLPPDDHRRNIVEKEIQTWK